MVGREAPELSNADITITNFLCTYTAEQVQRPRMIHSVFKVFYHLDLNGMCLFCSKKCEVSCISQGKGFFDSGGVALDMAR
jgi:hypothetical protein